MHRLPSGLERTVGNILWLLLAGIWLAIGYVIAGILNCITIIGIPFGVASFKMAVLALTPFGKEVVSADEAAGRHVAVVPPPASAR